MDEKEKLIVEIMGLAYMVQARTEFCVFIRFSGHVNQLEIDIRESKKDWQREVLKSEFYTAFERYYSDKDPLAELKAKRDILAEIINEQDIPYEDCDLEQYIVEEYRF